MARKKLFDLATLFAALFIAIASLGVSNRPTLGSWFQQPRKTISGEDLSQPDRDPVIITNLKVGNRQVAFKTPFDGEDEWMKDLSFEVKNHSTKTVTHVGVELFFSDSNSSAPRMVRQLRFGLRPGRQDQSNSAPISLKPGEHIDVLMNEQYATLKTFLERMQPVKSLDSLMIRVYLVFFDDGTKWDLGNFYVPDTAKPSGFRMVDAPAGIIKRN